MIATTTQVKTLQFWIPGKVVPKARPRFNSGQAYLPAAYRGWKSAAYLEVFTQLNKYTKILPIEKSAVEIQFVGRHRGDLDNLAGAVLDLLTETNVIVDDRVSCVPRLVIEHKPVGDLGVWVEVKPIL